MQCFKPPRAAQESVRKKRPTLKPDGGPKKPTKSGPQKYKLSMIDREMMPTEKTYMLALIPTGKTEGEFIYSESEDANGPRIDRSQSLYDKIHKVHVVHHRIALILEADLHRPGGFYTTIRQPGLSGFSGIEWVFAALDALVDAALIPSEAVQKCIEQTRPQARAPTQPVSRALDRNDSMKANFGASDEYVSGFSNAPQGWIPVPEELDANDLNRLQSSLQKLKLPSDLDLNDDSSPRARMLRYCATMPAVAGGPGGSPGSRGSGSSRSSPRDSPTGPRGQTGRPRRRHPLSQLN